MQSIYLWVLEIHVLIGGFALVAFWIAMGLRKGSERHRQVGRVFVVAMAISAWLALGMSVVVLIEPEIRPGALRGLFAALLFFAVLTLLLLARGMRAVRHRRANPNGWLVQHLVGILGASVIAHTAFVVSAIPLIMPWIDARAQRNTPLPWILPPLIGVGLIIWACHHYKPLYARHSTIQPSRPSPGAVLR